MMLDHKSPGGSQTNAVASTSGRHLSVELHSPRQIYTIGSTVRGLVHLGTKDRHYVQEVQVSLVCVVRSVYHRNYGGNAQDIRRETNNILHQDLTLWSRADGDASGPPDDFFFQFTIPEFGNDVKAEDPRVPLPPSFHPGRQRGWKNATYGTPIGYIKYHIKALVVRKGIFKHKERAFSPFVFFPPSTPPPLLPTIPKDISVPDLDRLDDLWSRSSACTNLRHGVFSTRGRSTLTLWVPKVPGFPRLMRIPFILCLVLQTRHVKDTSHGEPPSDVMPPAPQLDKASVHLTRHIRSCAKGGVQDHKLVFDQGPTDNFLYGITPQEGWWMPIKKDGESYWEKGYIWCGLWTCKEVPDFANRQLTWTYGLVAEVPIKGLGNEAKVSRDVEVSSGTGMDVVTTMSEEEDMLDLPPDYFDIEGLNDDEDEEHGHDKKGKDW